MPAAKSKPALPKRGLRIAAWLVLAAAVVMVIVARLRLSGLPLERDEGEYAYGGQLLLLGIAPYKLAYSMKLPGTMAVDALIMSILGQSITAVHVGLAVANLLTTVLIYFVARRLFGIFGGIASAACYSVLSLMPYVLGTAAHATHFVVLFAVGATFLLLRCLDRQSPSLIFASGFLFGVAFLMKQPGIFFAAFGLFYLVAHDWRARLRLTSILSRSMLFVTGAAVPCLVAALLLWKAGVFEKFWFWTFQYATQYGSQVTLREGWQLFAGHFFGVIGTAWPIWILGCVGVIALVVERTVRTSAGFLATFAIFSGLAVCPGLYFRPHYFILFLPALSLSVAAAVVAVINRFRTRSSSVEFAILAVLAACLAFPLWAERDFFFEVPIAQANTLINGTNPFPESIKISDYIREHSNSEDRIAILGSEPQIYFYSKRLSATGYIYTYSLMEPQPFAGQMQQEMIREIETARPRFLVLVVMSKSWLAGPESDQTIFRWADKYCETNYEEVGLINIFDSGTDYYFSARPPGVMPAPDHILIYRRKT
jgi:Dolichyl-phosphate-mannose-protein mannosyltransferase